MKTQLARLFAALALLALSTLNPQLSTAFAQGSLTPPGPPGPTMTTLSQVQPRTPISSAPYTITQPGSYYLTTNLTVASGDAIDINTNGVTLDLNGFTISSTSSFESGTAIYISFVSNGGNYFGFTDIAISNGHITGGVTNNAGVYGGPGFGNGISYFQAPPAPPYNVRVTGVTVSGCAYSGINVGTGNSTVVESCTVNSVGGSGIIASSVSHSTAYQCGSTAISADNASDCYGYCTGSGEGLSVNFTANNCYGNSDSYTGIYVSQGNANNCYGNSNGSGDGLYAGGSAENCYGNSSSGTGLSTGAANNCVGYTFGSGDGLDAGAAITCGGESEYGDGLNVSGGIAIGCIGESSFGTGLLASSFSYPNNSGIAIGCKGVSYTGAGINAVIANSCISLSSFGDSSITNKYNMP